MPNLRPASGVAAKRAKRGGRRRRHSKGIGLRGWWRMVRFALIVKRLRRRERSYPSLRQIALVVVSAGLAILIIRGASRRVAAKRAGAGSAAGETQDQAPAPEAPSEPPTPGGDDALTERVRTEMFESN